MKFKKLFVENIIILFKWNRNCRNQCILRKNFVLQSFDGKFRGTVLKDRTMFSLHKNDPPPRPEYALYVRYCLYLNPKFRMSFIIKKYLLFVVYNTLVQWPPSAIAKGSSSTLEFEIAKCSSSIFPMFLGCIMLLSYVNMQLLGWQHRKWQLELIF